MQMCCGGGLALRLLRAFSLREGCVGGRWRKTSGILFNSEVYSHFGRDVSRSNHTPRMRNKKRSTDGNVVSVRFGGLAAVKLAVVLRYIARVRAERIGACVSMYVYCGVRTTARVAWLGACFFYSNMHKYVRLSRWYIAITY